MVCPSGAENDQNICEMKRHSVIVGGLTERMAKKVVVGVEKMALTFKRKNLLLPKNIIWALIVRLTQNIRI